MKAKYRVVRRGEPYPYKIERKTFLFWHEIGHEESLEDAKRVMVRRCHIDNRLPEGTVLATYSTDDLIIDKLKGTE